MRNAANGHDPRSWLHRRSPAGPHYGHRLGYRSLTGNRTRHGHLIHRAAHACFHSVRASGSLSFRGGIVTHPGSVIDALTVPGPAGLVSILLAAAQEHFAASRYEAANAFLKLMRRPATNPAETWQQLGQLQFSLGAYDAAGRAYGFAAAYSPRDASLQVRLAHTCLCLGDIPSFKGYMNRALALDPENSPALQLLADLNRDEGRYAEAAGYYDRIIPSAPGHYENLLSLALCHSYLGAHEAALDCLQRAGQLARGALSPTTF